MRSFIYYAFKRNNITIPYPIQVEMSAEEGSVVAGARVVGADSLASVSLFSTLSPRRAHRIAGGGEAGAVRNRRGGRSSGSGRRVALRRRSRRGGGHARGHERRGGAAARGRRVRRDVAAHRRSANGNGDAATDCDLVEIDAEGFRSVVLVNPPVLEHVTSVAAARREGLDRHRESHAASPTAVEIRQSLLARVRHFLRL